MRDVRKYREFGDDGAECPENAGHDGAWRRQFSYAGNTFEGSRFWEAATYSPGRSQPNYDKQFVRDWLTQSGWNREPPAPELPSDIVEKTSLRYQEAYRRLTGSELSSI